jgi:putative MATE family efflux protein
MDKIEKSKKMGSMPIGKLIMVMSLPAMLSMFVQSMYNVVDSIFLGFYSEDALDAVNIALPMQFLLIAFAIGMAIGANSIIARKLGEGKADEASAFAKTGVIIAIFNAILFIIIAFTLSGVFSNFYAKTPEIARLSKSYLIIVLGCSFGAFIEIMLSKILQATGNMIVPMFSQLIGAVTNIILDPLFIFGKFGFPELGIQGAAVATIIGQIVAMLFVILMFFKRKQDVNLNFKGFKFQLEKALIILKIGLPTMVLNAVGSFTLMIMNAIIKQLSPNSITVLGLYFKMQSFIFMPVFGLNQGVMPVLAYNYGANNKDRFLKSYKLGIKIALGIMIAGFLMFLLIPHLLLKMFKADGDLLSEGIYAFRIISMCFIPAGFSIFIITMFQSVGHGIKSLIMSLLRQLGILLPLAVLFKSIWGLKGVWYSYPIAEVIVLIIFLPISIKTIHKLFDQKNNKSTLNNIQ